MSPDEYLNSASTMYREKSKVYGNNYKQFGKIMSAMFPDGLTVKSEEEWNRLHLFIMGMVKKHLPQNHLLCLSSFLLQKCQ